MNRREFFGRGAGALGAMWLLTSGPGAAESLPASSQIGIGIIGAGSRGQQLLRTLLRVPGVRIRALCDIYEPRFAQGRRITGEDTPTFRDYRQMLEQSDLDAVVVATPLSLHTEHVIAALESGRHVYGEKAMARTVSECDRIVDSVKGTGKQFQVGLQYHYAPWYRESLRRIRAGKIGRVTQIYAYWHRNNNWRRSVPDPHDPKLERLINWRLYKEYSGGLLAELGSHHVDFANELFGGTPQSVVASGGIDYWKDGRELEDNVQVTYRYPTGQTLFFSAITTNRLDGAQLRVYGTDGSVVLTEADATFYYEPGKVKPSNAPEALVEHGVVTGASYRAEMPYRGPGEPVQIPEDLAGNADYVAVRSFIDSLRNHQRPLADERVGWAAGVAVALGNQALEQGKRIVFSDHIQQAAGQEK